MDIHPLRIPAPMGQATRSWRQCRAIPCACILIMVMAMLTGCRQKELLSPEGVMCTVDVRFLWDNAPGAETEGMTLLFYPLDTEGSFWRYDIAGRDGGQVEIESGTYTMIAFNNDLPGIRLEDISYIDSAKAMTVAATKALADSTGMLYEGVIEDLRIMPGYVSFSSCDGKRRSGPDSRIECHPDSVTTIFDVKITDATGMERVRSLDGVLEGCAAGISLLTRQTLPDSVEVAFPMLTDPVAGTAAGSVSGFARTGSTAGYTLVLRARYTNGILYEKKIDVTEKILNYPYSHRVDIIINGLIFPENPSQGGDNQNSLGIDVGVDGWHTVEIDINNSF